ncbi:MAG: hypothetical protein JXA25_16570 [Anaerolineales bacterium]|nr:hypothetical protein [Anaerolineales bacterium]
MVLRQGWKKFVVLLVLVCLFVPIQVFAQEEEGALQLRMRKDFGFNAGLKIQGKFTLSLSGSDSFSRVDFYVDEELVYSDDSAPFEYAFHTDSIGLGTHAFFAVAIDANGKKRISETLTREVVSAEEGWQTAGKIALPILAFSLLAALLGTAGPMLLGRKNRSFELGKYGLMGGVVCPRCGLPYSRSFLAPNLLFGKLVRCPHCGKVAVLRAASAETLRTAEDRFRSQSGEGAFSGETEEESLRRSIEDSRFEK